MSIDIFVKELKNNCRPEVKTENIVNWDEAPGSWFGLLENISEALNLRLIQQQGNTYRFKFPGSWIIGQFQLDIFRSIAPNPEPYRRLHALIELTKVDERRVAIKIFERMIGTKQEREAYRQVLKERMEEVIGLIQSRQFV